MKAFLLSLSFACITAGAAVAQEQATVVQEPTTTSINGKGQGHLRLGAGLAYGSEAGMSEDGSGRGGVGINLNGEYFFNEKISAAPSFTYFLKSEAEFYGMKMSAQASSLNLDGRYYFANNNGLSFYGLAGLTVAFAKVTMDDEGNYGMGQSSSSDNKAGVNLGAGLTYPLQNNLDLNAQVKYNTPLEQIVIQAGISFPIN